MEQIKYNDKGFTNPQRIITWLCSPNSPIISNVSCCCSNPTALINPLYINCPLGVRIFESESMWGSLLVGQPGHWAKVSVFKVFGMRFNNQLCYTVDHYRMILHAELHISTLLPCVHLYLWCTSSFFFFFYNFHFVWFCDISSLPHDWQWSFS